GGAASVEVQTLSIERTRRRDRNRPGVPVHRGRELTAELPYRAIHDRQIIMRKRRSPTPSPCIRRAGPGTAAAIWLGCFVVNVIPMATAASGHVKWFVPCDVSSDPLPLNQVFTTTFWLLAALFALLLTIACWIEKTAPGESLSRILDDVTAPLHRQ